MYIKCIYDIKKHPWPSEVTALLVVTAGTEPYKYLNNFCCSIGAGRKSCSINKEQFPRKWVALKLLLQDCCKGGDYLWLVCYCCTST